MNRSLRTGFEWLLLLIVGMLLLGSCNLLKGKGAGSGGDDPSGTASGGGASRAEGSLGDGDGGAEGQPVGESEEAAEGGTADEGEEAADAEGAESGEGDSAEDEGTDGEGSGGEGSGGEGSGEDSGSGEGSGGSESGSEGEGDSGAEGSAEDDLSDIKGRDVYMQSNCQMCHGVKLNDGKLGPPLDNIGRYWDEADLIDFLKNPKDADERYPRVKELKDSGKYVMEMSPIAETDERRIRALARWLIDET